jgi:hypothetical protein
MRRAEEMFDTVFEELMQSLDGGGIISSWDTPSPKEEEKEKEEEEEEEEEEEKEEEGRVRPWALPPPRVADPPLTKQCVAQVAAHVHDPLYSTHEH